MENKFVRCVDNDAVNTLLTKNKIYKVTKETEGYYYVTDDYVTDDRNTTDGYLKARFKPVKGKVVQCVDAKDLLDTNITHGNYYEVVGEWGKQHVQVIDDDGKVTIGLYRKRFVDLIFPNETKPNKMEVPKEFVLEAHKAACADWKKKIENQFPELFSTFEFGQSVTITGLSETPLIIGEGLAPDEKFRKCLVVRDGWDMVVEEHKGRKILSFKRK